MKKRVLTLFAAIFVFGAFLFVIQALQFGSLTGYSVFDLSNKLGFNQSEFGIIAALLVFIVIFEIVIFLIYEIRGKKFSENMRHDLR